MNAYNPDQFVRDNMPLAYSLARKYYLSYYGPQHGTNQAYEEFCSAALLGLVQASKKFDPSLGFKPTTYAWPSILREIINVQRMLRSDTILSGCRHKPMFHVPEVGFFSQRPREICDMEDGGFCLDESQQQWELNEICDEAHALMGLLTERQKQIIRMRFFKGISLSQIAQRIRVSKERVRQLIEAALIRMRAAAGVSG